MIPEESVPATGTILRAKGPVPVASWQRTVQRCHQSSVGDWVT